LQKKQPKYTTMKHFIRPMIIALFAIIPIFLLAQSDNPRIVEKRPDLSSPLARYSDSPNAKRQIVREVNPAIASMVSAINADTLRATLKGCKIGDHAF
jgi:hypothetical protein